MLEDVAVPVAKLAEVTKDLQSLFKEYNYNDVVIFGNALSQVTLITRPRIGRKFAPYLCPILL
jgi:FAD/FMN-containing dehydrogenase